MPIAYQGSKQRLVGPLVDALEHRFGPAVRWPAWFDLCCGSAAVTLEVLRRAPALQATAVDVGPWGWFWTAWQADPEGVRRELRALYARGDTRGARGTTTHARGGICAALHEQKVAADPARRAAQFLVALRGGYMGRLPTIDEAGRWSVTCNLRSGAGKSADFLLTRLAAVPQFRAVHGYAEQVAEAAPTAGGPPPGAVVYIDPGYRGLNGHYNDTCDVPRIVRAVTAAAGRVALSHHTAYPEVHGASVRIAAARCLREVCREEILIFPRESPP